MNDQELRYRILRTCKVDGASSDFNIVAFNALCDALVDLGRVEEREACAKVCDELEAYKGHACAYAIRARREK